MRNIFIIGFGVVGTIMLWKFKKSDDKFNSRIPKINHQVSNDILLDIGNMQSHFSGIAMMELSFLNLKLRPKTFFLAHITLEHAEWV